MTPADNYRATAEELVLFGRERGIDLEPLQNDFVFKTGRRWIDVWRKDEPPYSGPAGEPTGTLHYSIQGAVGNLPRKLKAPADAFRGVWTEAGVFSNLDQALEFFKAWMLEEREVDDLPDRHVRRYGV